MAKVQCVVLLCVVAAVFHTAQCDLSEEDKTALKALMVPILTECGKEHSVSLDDVKAAKKAEDVDALNPCYYACFFKKISVINDEGLYAPEVAKEGYKNLIHDEEFVSKLDAITDTCTAINEKDVSDGAEGCERAKLLVNCYKENKDSFSPFLE